MPGVHEPARETPLLGEYEVVVIGGGPAGITAAASAASASSICLASTSQARPARSASTPLMRNMSEGNSMSPAVLPFSKGAPDHAAMSASPEQSMNTWPRIACLPDLDSTNTASIRFSAAMLIPVTIAWYSSVAPAAPTRSSAAIL